MSSSEALLSVRDLTVEFDTDDGVLRAVDHVDLDIQPGEIIGLVGVSGAGKSSAALALMGIVTSPGAITAGQLHFEGRDLLKLSDEQLRRIRGDAISLIVQSPRAALNPMLTVGRQIENVLVAHRSMGRRERAARAVEMLELVGINDAARRVKAYPHELSGGMAQRMLIAMALVCEPRLLIADEPSSGLDVTIQAQILDDLYRGVRSTGSAAVIVTQDFGVVANYCDRVVVMYGGRVVESVSVAGFFSEPGHPSAEALLSSQTGAGDIRLVGPAYDFHEPPPGCPVSASCPWSQEDPCARELPELRPVGAGHRVRCDRYEDIRDEIAAGMAGRSALG